MIKTMTMTKIPVDHTRNNNNNNNNNNTNKEYDTEHFVMRSMSKCSYSNTDEKQ